MRVRGYRNARQELGQPQVALWDGVSWQPAVASPVGRTPCLLVSQAQQQGSLDWYEVASPRTSLAKLCGLPVHLWPSDLGQVS